MFYPGRNGTQPNLRRPSVCKISRRLLHVSSRPSSPLVSLLFSTPLSILSHIQTIPPDFSRIPSRSIEPKNALDLANTSDCCCRLPWDMNGCSAYQNIKLLSGNGLVVKSKLPIPVVSTKYWSMLGPGVRFPVIAKNSRS
jgi:hypothetical protein